MIKVIRPFGPTIAKVKMSKDLIDELNSHLDGIVSDAEKSKKQDYGKYLAGNVKNEFQLEKDYITLSGLKAFLEENTKEWILQSTKQEIKKFEIIDSWIVRQFENEYNPLHSHGGHISGVGYLKLPKTFGETFQKNKKENYNGKLQLVHGSRMFLSPVNLNIQPELGDFYFFPNYLMHRVYPFLNSNEERRSISFNAHIDNDIYNVHGSSLDEK